jgi:hypothetical protein
MAPVDTRTARHFKSFTSTSLFLEKDNSDARSVFRIASGLPPAGSGSIVRHDRVDFHGRPGRPLFRSPELQLDRRTRTLDRSKRMGPRRRAQRRNTATFPVFCRHRRDGYPAECCRHSAESRLALHYLFAGHQIGRQSVLADGQFADGKGDSFKPAYIQCRDDQSRYRLNLPCHPQYHNHRRRHDQSLFRGDVLGNQLRCR